MEEAKQGGASLQSFESFIDGAGMNWDAWYAGYQQGIQDARLYGAAVLEATRTRFDLVKEHKVFYDNEMKGVIRERSKISI